MAITFRVTQEIPAAPDQVFSALTNLDDASEWMPGLVRIEPMEPGALHVGSQWRETRKLFGKEATEQFEVTELAAPTRFGLRVDGTKGSSRTGEYLFAYSIEPASRGTTVTLEGEIRGLRGILGVIGKLMLGSYKKMCVKDLQALSDHLSSGGARSVRLPVS